MKRSLRTWPLIASCLLLASTGVPAAEPGLKVERVVMLMRHGIRPPTKLQPIPEKYSPQPWPQWTTAPGLLTPHGAKGIGLLAAADRAWFVGAGLLPATGCPAAGQVSVRASKVPRAIETAQAWTKGALPDCGVTVQYPAKDEPDSLFHVLATQPSWFDGQRAYADALAQAPKGGLAEQAKELGPQMRRMEAVLGCAPPACDLATAATTLVEQPHDAPKFHGPLDTASTASESFLLEYLDGKPMAEVGWGRVNREEIERLLIFNVTKFKYADRPPYIAQATAGPIAKAILEALNAPAGPRITVLAGHDTNIADLGGLLGLHWRVASYLPDDIPPGSAIGFELLSDGRGRQIVRAFFRAQRMDQLRNLEPLNAANPQHREIVAIPGCGLPEQAHACELQAFTRLVEAKLQ